MPTILRNARLGSLITGLIVIATPLAGHAMPFSPDPISFAGWLNNAPSWTDRSLKIKFENLGACSYSYFMGSESYSCKIGYAYISDGMGARKCRVETNYNGTDRQANYNQYDCRSLTTEERGKDLLKQLRQWWRSQ